MMIPAIFFILSLVCEAFAIYILVQGEIELYVEVFLAFHLFASLSIAFCIWFFLPEKYKYPTKFSVALLALFNFVAPIFALLAFMVYIYIWRSFKESVELDYEKVGYSELFEERISLHKRRFGESSLNMLAKRESAPVDLRLKAFTLLKELQTPKSIGLIKEGLKDKNDEIRLYSFSVVDSLEKELNGKIHEVLNRYKDEKSDKMKAHYAAQLAKLYWEYIYTGISDLELRKYLCDKVEFYAKKAVRKYNKDPDLFVLMGKVELKRGDIEKAKIYFQKAVENGASEYRALPFLAEIYYYSGEFGKVKEIFSKQTHLKLDPYLYPIASLWDGQHE